MQLYNATKVVKTNEDQSSRVKLAIFTIKDNKMIVIDTTYTQQDLDGKSCFDIICELMDSTKCFYALYDCQFETKDGVQKSDLVFLTWTSDGATVKEKMIYASSKENLKRGLQGLKHSLQINDRSDWSRQAIAEKIAECSTYVAVKIEGIAV